jgi:uncharacterized protein DUF4157
MKEAEPEPKAKEKEEQKAAPRASRATSRDTPDASKNSVLNLQRAIGNQGVLRLLHSGVIQAKLRVSQPGDADEVEADRVAEAVTAGSNTATPTSPAPSGAEIHRKCACVGGGSSCPECGEEEVEEAKGIHRKSSSPSPDVAEASDDLVQSLGSGQPLEPTMRASMESSFGQDFGRVRIHTDEPAASAARSINARAFTTGSDIVFGSGEFSPETKSGKNLLAHELAHVGQQKKPGTARRVQRVGLIESIARLFGGGTFSDEELQQYLASLDKNNRIEDHYDSDNKAREIVRQWQSGDPKYLLSTRRKVLLIREMLTGFTSHADEIGILALLAGSGSTDFNFVVDSVTEQELQSNISGKERKRLDFMLASRRKKAAPQGSAEAVAAAEAAKDESSKTFPSETIVEAQHKFTENAESKMRKNCIDIARYMVPQLFAQDPQLAKRLGAALARLHGATLTMPDAGRVLAELGAAVGPMDIRFNNGNGNQEPTKMLGSAWDTILQMAGKVEGWHIFGMAVFDGYHSVTVFVDNRPDGPRVYWADQWAIETEEEKTKFHQEPGSVSGFRRYEKAGFDKFIEEKTNEWWREVHSSDSKCAEGAAKHHKNWDTSCRYNATLKIWHFQRGS